MANFLFKNECYEIIGAAMEVHNELGPGFLESVYQEALAIVFEENGIPYIKEKVLNINFRDRILNKKFSADFFCYDEIIVEIKAASALSQENISQVLNYLKATGKRVGLLINFGALKLEYKRVII